MSKETREWCAKSGQKCDTCKKEEYEEKKQEQFMIWLGKVFSNSMCSTVDEEEKLYDEAVAKFNDEYPKYSE